MDVDLLSDVHHSRQEESTCSTGDSSNDNGEGASSSSNFSYQPSEGSDQLVCDTESLLVGLPDQADQDCNSDASTVKDSLQPTNELRAASTVLTLEEITGSSYYHELASTAVTRNIDFFASVCRHKVGERLSCLKQHFANLSQSKMSGKGYYSFGRVLYLTMLWEEGMAYINNLSDQETKEEIVNCSSSENAGGSVTGSTKNQLLQWLKVVAQSAINGVVAQLNSNSLDILNAIAEEEEAVMISSDIEEYITQTAN